MHLKYFLPFVGADGASYHVEVRPKEEKGERERREERERGERRERRGRKEKERHTHSHTRERERERSLVLLLPSVTRVLCRAPSSCMEITALTFSA